MHLYLITYSTKIPQNPVIMHNTMYYSDISEINETLVYRIVARIKELARYKEESDSWYDKPDCNIINIIPVKAG